MGFSNLIQTLQKYSTQEYKPIYRFYYSRRYLNKVFEKIIRLVLNCKTKLYESNR